MSLYNRYRPSTFQEMIGNDIMIRSLQNDLAKPDPPRAILIHGPFGSGKTSLGRIIAHYVGCSDSDYFELHSSVFRGIDTVRDVQQKCNYKPVSGKYKVFLWDEVHQIGSVAMPAMLKMLEDTPKHIIHILATTDPQKLLPTIRSRCAQYQVSTLSDEDMLKLLKSIVKKEGQKLEQEIYDQIIQDSQGHPRDALQILDHVLAVDVSDRLHVARRSAENTTQIIALCRALLSNASWSKVSVLLKGLKEEEPESIRRAVFNYMGSVLLNGENDRAACIMDEFVKPTYDNGFHDVTWAAYKVVKS
jgi:DNA polymerase III gamma/tau subunit